MQAITDEQAAVAADLYALVVYLHKNCNADLFRAVGVLELNLTLLKLLHYLETAETDLSLKALAEMVPMSLPAASRAVEDLVQRGFVDRWEDSTDRRMKRVKLTDAGRQVTLRLNAARLNGFQQFATDLTTDERDSLAGALSTLLARPEIAACRPSGDQTP
jgi:DNA-binding MarR family transcriptional regulator